MKKLRTMIATIGATALIAISGTGVLAAPAGLSSPAADLRVALARLLSEHAQIAMEAMRQGVDTGDLSDPEFTAAAGALQGNTDDLTAAIESVYGANAGEAFRAQWEAHIGFFVDYTVGVATDDQAAKDAALEDLAGYRADFSEFLATATEGGLPAEAAADALAVHVQTLVDQIDLYAAGDYAAAYEKAREAYAHMYMTADALSLAIIRQDAETFTGSDLAWSPAVDLQITLDRLLGEHALIAIEAMRNGLTGAADFDASTAALQGNTDDLTAAIESVYGADAGEAFRAQWEAHIGFFVDYTVALAGGDTAAQEAALEDLAGYREDFSNFLDTATGGNVPADGAADALAAHVDQLIAAIDAYANDDFAAAFAAEREGFAHMFMTGQVLAGGIAGQFPDEFPTTPIPSDTAVPPPSAVPGAAVFAGLFLTVAGVAVGLKTSVVRSDR